MSDCGQAQTATHAECSGTREDGTRGGTASWRIRRCVTPVIDMGPARIARRAGWCRLLDVGTCSSLHDRAPPRCPGPETTQLKAASAKRFSRSCPSDAAACDPSPAARRRGPFSGPSPGCARPKQGNGVRRAESEWGRSPPSGGGNPLGPRCPVSGYIGVVRANSMISLPGDVCGSRRARESREVRCNGRCSRRLIEHPACRVS